MSEIRTLIVDDSSVMRKIVERALRQAGLDLLVVHEAGSGVEGLDVLKVKQVDLILSDINMPSMDGLEFLRQIREQNLAPGVPVVMITTESSEEHVKQAIQAGARGYIRKPFTAEQVKERACAFKWSAGSRHRVQARRRQERNGAYDDGLVA
jgi:two-component system chemotaxis response regulator CheY